MDERLMAICAAHGSFFRHEALDLGYDDRDLRAAIRAGVLTRIRHGAYTSTAQWSRASEHERHRLLCRTIMRSMKGRVALAGVSSLVERGVSTWGIDLSKVHVIRLDDGAGRIEGDVIHHEGRVVDDDIEEVNGLLVVRSSRGLVEAAGRYGVKPGLVCADSALHQGVVTHDEFAATYARMQGSPRTRPVQLVLRLADGRAESPGETIARYLCWTQGLPMPELQFKVYDENGTLVAITDFAWHQLGVLGEFDGRIKYGRLLKEGQDPGEAVFQEKTREDQVRELTRLPMVRFIWDHFRNAASMAARVRRLARTAA